MRIRKLSIAMWVSMPVLLAVSAALAQEQIPSGTAIPVMLNLTLSPRKLQSGQSISARVMQDVPLPGGGKIPERTKITGHVISVQAGTAGSPARISFAFDQLHLYKQSVSIKTGLRALASMTAVEGAQLPLRGMGEGESWDNRTTVQVGGDTVYWGGGPVTGPMGIVGKPVTGSDSQVLGRLTPNPKAGCYGETDSLGTQALWVFSSDACGVYGLPGVTIVHSDKTQPPGMIELTARNDNLKIPSGSGLLLRVVDAK